MARKARAQHSLIRRDQLAACGVPAGTVDAWVQTGRLERLHAGVYRTAGAVETWQQRAMAAVLAAPGVLSHRAAAHLWKMGDHDIIEISVSTGHPRVPGVVVHRSSDLSPKYVTRHHGIPVTNPMRTLVDLGAVDKWVVGDALERALIARVCSVVAVERVLDDVARRGRRGAGVIRRVLDDRALGRARPDGLLEARFARLLREHGLPAASFQHQVGRYRVDFAYPELMIAIEVDGFEVHATPAALQADLERQNALVADGWTVLRFTWSDVVRRPGPVAREVGSLLRQRQRTVA